MKSRKLRDILVGCFLVSTLGLTTFIVSCSEDMVNSPGSFGNETYQPHIHNDAGVVSSAVTATFSAVGQGAARELGSVGMGWMLGAMGLTSSSGPNWEKEFNKINQDLQEIINLLNSINEELVQIQNTLNLINCTLQQTSLQPYLAAIETELQAYNTIALTASQGDTISNIIMTNFANNVINGTGSQPSIADALNNIKVNAGGVIQGCLPLVPVPGKGTFGQDSVYYKKAQSLLNNYYYYQTIGLGLLSEAYHYRAWLAAGSPGGGSGYSSDSVQKVCYANSNAALECNTVINQTNNVYNTLLTQFKFTGAPYSGSDLIYQKDTSGKEFVWVRSLEDYTSQSGASCNYPLASVQIGSTPINVCGPTAGIYPFTLSHTSYYGTENFVAPNFTDLNGLVTPISNISTTDPLYVYLQKVGFENMSNKVLLSDTLMKIHSSISNGWYFLDTMHIIPFINAVKPIFKNHGGVMKAIYSDANDILVAMVGYSATNISNSGCGNSVAPAIQVNWQGNPLAPPWGLAGGYQKICEYTQYNPPQYVALTPFTWNSTGAAAGWSYYSINSNPQKAFFIPVRKDFSGSTGCLSGYSNLNTAGFMTKCGQDFQSFLNLNLPVPPTCSIANSTPCTVLP